MSDAKPSVKRNYFRSAVSATTRARLVDPAQLGEVRKCFDISMLSDIAWGGDTANKQALSLIVATFNRIEDKLDRILDKLESDGGQGRELDVRDTLDISGSGISLLISRSLPENQMLHLSIVFHGSHRGRIEVLGRVVRSAPLMKGQESFYHTGIEFVDLNEGEKDLLVKYTFSQHRKHIRASAQNDR